MPNGKLKELTPEQVAEKAASLVLELEPLLDKENPEGFTSQREKLKAALSYIDSVKDVDLKALSTAVEKQKATQEQIVSTIRNRKDGFYVSGMEGVKFNVLKVIAARQMGWEKAGAQHERDVLLEVVKKHGERLYNQKGQTVGDAESGGSFVPDQVIPDLIGGIYKQMVLVKMAGEGTQRVSVLDGLTGAPVRIPRWDRGMSAQWIGEEKAPTATKAKTGSVNANPKKVAIAGEITKELLMMADSSFSRLWEQEFSLTVAEELDRVGLYGTGTEYQPRGIVQTPGIRVYSAQKKGYGVLGTDALGGAAFQADWTGAEVDFKLMDEGIDLVMLEDDVRLDASAAWISSPRFFKRLKNRKSDQYSMQPEIKQLYVVGPPIMSDARLREMIGDFDYTNHIKSNKKPGASINAPSASGTAKFTDLFRALWSTIVFCRWGGVEIDDDGGVGTGFLKDVTNVKLTMICDFVVRQPRYVVLCPDAQTLD